MTYSPVGDPGGGSDGYSGSLFAIGHADQHYVSEFSIPAPVISPTKNLADLPRARTLQPFADVTGGKQYGYVSLMGLQYYPKQGAQTSDKLHWAMWDYYVPVETKLHGWSELDFSKLQSQGSWALNIPTLNNTAAQSRYLFEIPRAWADRYIPGKYLATGRKRPGQSQGSYGPALYAFAPWEHGDPPADGSKLNPVQLLYYPDGSRTSDLEHSWGDEWSDGAWLTVGEKQAVVFAGRRSLRNFKNGLEYYGPPLPGHIGGKGFHSDPYYAAIIFYDPDELAEIAQGHKASYEAHPYAVFNATKYLYPREYDGGTDGLWELGGIGYDRKDNLLYVLQRGVDGLYGRAPIVHVWRLSDAPGEVDAALPSQPGNLRAADKGSNHVELAWEAASDNKGVSGYVVYKNGMFIGVTNKLTYKDAIVSPGTVYSYSVAAFDCSNNYGPQAPPIRVTTDAGTDKSVPLLERPVISNITAGSAAFTWQTDEPSITKIEYGIQHASEDPKVIENRTLTRSHLVNLSNLKANSDYYYSLTAEDAFGNSHHWMDSMGKFHTANPAPDNNQAPKLTSIGGQALNEGQNLELIISGTDPENKRIYFSADGLPDGSMFNSSIYDSQPAKAWFGWIPRSGQAGSYKVTFTISDGALSSSETVTITVGPQDTIPPAAPRDVRRNFLGDRALKHPPAAE